MIFERGREMHPLVGSGFAAPGLSMEAFSGLSKYRVGVCQEARGPSVSEMTRESGEGDVFAENTIVDSKSCGTTLAQGIGWNWLELACNRLRSATNGPESAAIGFEWAGIGRPFAGRRDQIGTAQL